MPLQRDISAFLSVFQNNILVFSKNKLLCISPVISSEEQFEHVPLKTNSTLFIELNFLKTCSEKYLQIMRDICLLHVESG